MPRTCLGWSINWPSPVKTWSSHWLLTTSYRQGLLGRRAIGSWHNRTLPRRGSVWRRRRPRHWGRQLRLSNWRRWSRKEMRSSRPRPLSWPPSRLQRTRSRLSSTKTTRSRRNCWSNASTEPCVKPMYFIGDRRTLVNSTWIVRFTRVGWSQESRWVPWRHKKLGQPKLRRASALKFKTRLALGWAVAFSCYLFVSFEVGVWPPPFAVLIYHPFPFIRSFLPLRK